ncbi:MAG: hypothetical protein ACXWIO_09670 [Croceibacterium sp.]
MQFIPSNVLPVVVFRDPFDWIQSLYRKPWHYREGAAKEQFGQFIRAPVDTQMDDDLWYDSFANVELLPLHQMIHSLLSDWILPRIKGRLGLTVHQTGRNERLPDVAHKRSLQLDRHPISGKRIENPIQMRNLKNAAFLGYRERGCPCVFVRYEFVRQDAQGFLNLLAQAFNIRLSEHFHPVAEWLGGMPGERAPVDRLDQADVQFVLENLHLDQEYQLGYGERLERHAAEARSKALSSTSELRLRTASAQ